MNEVIGSGALWFAVPLALLAGLVSFASPCILPLVPGYLGYLGGAAAGGKGQRRYLIGGVALFIAGFGLLFTAYGSLFGALGGWLLQWQDPLTRILGIVVILMGFIFIGALRRFQGSARLNIRPKATLVGAPVLGVVFGLGWTPCLGPTLAAISALSVGTGSPLRGALLTLVYSLGLGAPFLILAAGFGWASAATGYLRRHIRTINLIGGIIMIAVGLLMVSGVWTAMLYSLQSVIGGVVLPI